MVEYFLSGVVEARVDGTKVPLGGPKQRCVLAVLLANNDKVVSIDRLIDSVWEDDPPPKALASLRSYVTNLRRTLNAGAVAAERLQSRPYGYQLSLLDGDLLDLHEFQRLVSAGRSALTRNDPAVAADALGAALALWHGDPFGEFTYRDFAAPDALRFAELRVTAIESRFDAVLQLGAGAELVPEIEAAVAQYPLQERLWGHLMLALYRAGRTADATRAFHRACATLDREIGTRPGEDLQSLFQRISERSPDLEVERPKDQAAPERSAAPTLVGRDAELSAVLQAARSVGAGLGGLTLVTGESGIGKTSLAHAAVDLVGADGVAVAWAAHPSGIRLPLLWSWIQLLRHLGADLGDAARRAVLRAAPGVVDALVPEWNDLVPLASGTRVAATGFALVEGIVTALSAMASIRPLLLVLDDLQLADSASRNALSLLAAQFPRVPIQVIGTWTYHGADRPVNRSSFERLIRSNDTRVVHLGGIDRQAAAQLVDAIAGAPIAEAVADQVWRQAGGNPFYIKELARALQAAAADDRGAESVTSHLSGAVVGVVGRRLSVLDRACREVVAAAAVLGPEFDVAELADVVDSSTATVQARLRPAYQAGLLDEVSGRPGMYRFSHGLLRDALLAQLDAVDRTAVHAAVANTRAAGLAAAAYEDGIAAADHAWRAGTELNPESALEIHEAVIQRALARSAYDDIANLAEHALQICRRLPAKPEELERQATLWLHLAGAKGILEGQTSSAAAEAAQRAFEIGSEVKGRSFYGATAVQCLMLCAHGRIDEAQIIANGLREQYELSGDPDIGVADDFAHSMVYSLRGDVEALIATGRHMMDAFPPPETVTDPMHFFHPRVYCWMALGEATRGDRDAMHEYYRCALHLAQSRGDVFNILAARLTFVECAAIVGEVAGTAELADRVDREFCAAGGQQWGAAARIIAVWARTLETGEGDPGVALQAFDILTGDGSSAMTPLFLCLLADIESHHGRTDSAREFLERAQRVAEATGEHAEDRMIAARVAALTATD